MNENPIQENNTNHTITKVLKTILIIIGGIFALFAPAIFIMVKSFIQGQDGYSGSFNPLTGLFWYLIILGILKFRQNTKNMKTTREKTPTEKPRFVSAKEVEGEYHNRREYLQQLNLSQLKNEPTQLVINNMTEFGQGIFLECVVENGMLPFEVRRSKSNYYASYDGSIMVPTTTGTYKKVTITRFGLQNTSNTKYGVLVQGDACTFVYNKKELPFEEIKQFGTVKMPENYIITDDQLEKINKRIYK